MPPLPVTGAPPPALQEPETHVALRQTEPAATGSLSPRGERTPPCVDAAEAEVCVRVGFLRHLPPWKGAMVHHGCQKHNACLA